MKAGETQEPSRYAVRVDWRVSVSFQLHADGFWIFSCLKIKSEFVFEAARLYPL